MRSRGDRVVAEAEIGDGGEVDDAGVGTWRDVCLTEGAAALVGPSNGDGRVVSLKECPLRMRQSATTQQRRPTRKRRRATSEQYKEQ
jgi:hypothetical protein